MSTTDVPAGIAATEEITLDELQLAARNHGMPLEALRYDVTPPGMHYVLTHFDIPACDETSWAVRHRGGWTSCPQKCVRAVCLCSGAISKTA